MELEFQYVVPKSRPTTNFDPFFVLRLALAPADDVLAVADAPAAADVLAAADRLAPADVVLSAVDVLVPAGFFPPLADSLLRACFLFRPISRGLARWI